MYRFKRGTVAFSSYAASFYIRCYLSIFTSAKEVMFPPALVS